MSRTVSLDRVSATGRIAAPALMAATGLCSAVTDVSLITVVQRRVPEQHLAKVLGLWEAGIADGAALSAPLAAAVITLAGLAAGFALCGAALMAAAFASAWLLRRLTAARGGADRGRPAPALISARHCGPSPPSPRGTNTEPVGPISTERSTTCCP